MEQLLFPDKIKFREWLEKQHAQCKGAWLVFSKTKELESIKPEEALEEALCFGWIDGQIKSIDDTRYIKKFTPRSKGSKWSEKNRNLAISLISQGRMLQQGYLAIERAKSEGTWEIEKPEPISEEQIEGLERRIAGHEPAYSNFLKMSKSVKRTYTAHYLSAKTEATREKRLVQIVERLNENKKPM